MNLADLFIAKKLAGGGGGGTGTDNYNDLSNKPQINSTALTGDKSASDLGLQSEIDSDNKISADYVDDTDANNKFVSSAEKLEWSGKQDAIDADHKLDADYVDDTTSDNKFVTASDKTTWNNKQNAIDSSHKLSSDLVDDTGHTNLFVTSTEKSTWSGKQDKIDSSHKLSSTLVSFDSSEAAALASGIDSTKVSQIATNQTNILYNLQNGVKNICEITLNRATSDTVTFTNIGNNTVSVKTSSATTQQAISAISDKQYVRDRYIVYVNPSTAMSNDYWFVNVTYNDNGVTGNVNIFDFYEFNGDTEITGVYIYVRSGKTIDATAQVMICTKAAWAQEPNVYRPPALPNSDLTQLEAEDRAALAEVVDSGAKNKLQYDLASLKALNTDGTWNNNAYTISGITYTLNSDMSISISGTRSSGGAIFNLADYTPVSGDMMSQGTVGTYNVFFYARGGSSSCNGVGNSLIASADIGVNRTYALAVTSESAVNQRYYPMICTKAAFGVSKAFVPYRPNYSFVCDNVTRLTGYKSERKSYTSQAADTYEYSGYSFTVPAWHQYFFTACVQYEKCRPDAIMISTKSDATALTTASIIAENKADISTTPVVRSITGITPIIDHVQTYYIWVKYQEASKMNYISYNYMDYMS